MKQEKQGFCELFVTIRIEETKELPGKLPGSNDIFGTENYKNNFPPQIDARIGGTRNIKAYNTW
jgi:hypothetical protein